MGPGPYGEDTAVERHMATAGIGVTRVRSVGPDWDFTSRRYLAGRPNAFISRASGGVSLILHAILQIHSTATRTAEASPTPYIPTRIQPPRGQTDDGRSGEGNRIPDI